jgi:hypothetical protein
MTGTAQAARADVTRDVRSVRREVEVFVQRVELMVLPAAVRGAMLRRLALRSEVQRLAVELEALRVWAAGLEQRQAYLEALAAVDDERP